MIATSRSQIYRSNGFRELNITTAKNRSAHFISYKGWKGVPKGTVSTRHKGYIHTNKMWLVLFRPRY